MCIYPYACVLRYNEKISHSQNRKYKNFKLRQLKKINFKVENFPMSRSKVLLLLV
jgi:hypothetical protein